MKYNLFFLSTITVLISSCSSEEPVPIEPPTLQSDIPIVDFNIAISGIELNKSSKSTRADDLKPFNMLPGADLSLMYSRIPQSFMYAVYGYDDNNNLVYSLSSNDKDAPKASLTTTDNNWHNPEPIIGVGLSLPIPSNLNLKIFFFNYEYDNAPSHPYLDYDNHRITIGYNNINDQLEMNPINIGQILPKCYDCLWEGKTEDLLSHPQIILKSRQAFITVVSNIFKNGGMFSMPHPHPLDPDFNGQNSSHVDISIFDILPMTCALIDFDGYYKIPYGFDFFDNTVFFQNINYYSSYFSINSNSVYDKYSDTWGHSFSNNYYIPDFPQNDVNRDYRVVLHTPIFIPSDKQIEEMFQSPYGNDKCIQLQFFENYLDYKNRPSNWDNNFEFKPCFVRALELDEEKCSVELKPNTNIIFSISH